MFVAVYNNKVHSIRASNKAFMIHRSEFLPFWNLFPHLTWSSRSFGHTFKAEIWIHLKTFEVHTFLETCPGSLWVSTFSILKGEEIRKLKGFYFHCSKLNHTLGVAFHKLLTILLLDVFADSSGKNRFVGLPAWVCLFSVYFFHGIQVRNL